ncbi:putative reverse transcriptase domain-containing protein [Tanacetum coccineum]
MDQKPKGYARSAENKRRFDNNPRDNHGQQPAFKRQNFRGQNVARAYTAGNNEKRRYVGSFPYCNKCKMHHAGPCTVKCGNYKRVLFVMRNQNCGNKTGNKTRNKTRNNEATPKAYAIGRGGANPDSNVVTGTFLLNNYYASMLFDSGADRSFVSSTFSALLNVAPSTLDTSHPFDIDLMLVELGSFNVIINMDWLAKNHAMIVYDEKIVCIPYGDEMLIIRGDDYDSGSKSKLNIISCTKTQKYIPKGCQVYLAQVTSKKTEDKLEEKRLEDVPIVWEFPEVFPENLLGLPLARRVKFQIDLVLGVAPVARAPYRLASTKMQELSTQLQELSDKGFIRPSSLIDDLFDQLQGSRVYSKIHLRSGYHQLRSKKEHEGHLKLILRLLKEEELYAMFSKCDFWVSKLQFLGHVIDSEGIHIDPAKIESIKDWVSPKTPTEGSENFVVYCDASHKGLGAVLMQKEKVIAYASRQLKCVVFTDHKSLQHILDQKELNMRQ